ncbi:MAG: hypothetical protein JSR73_04045 [Proteobacteria bacterium]|nr:hypothetical protein [Pseudomonadota bacterium]
MALGLAVFIVLGFAQFAARGFVDYRTVPFWFHVHGIAMVTWLALIIIQSRLARGASLAVHRRLGWSTAALIPVLIVLAFVTMAAALHAHVQPPFFTPTYFLALVTVEALAFGGLAGTALLLRRDTNWHARLILGAAVIAMQPALGRILPMPLLGPWGEWLGMLVQLGAVGLIVRHDWRQFGRFHPATGTVAATVVAAHIAPALVAALPAVRTLAMELSG